VPEFTNIVLTLVLMSIIVYQGVINWLDRKDARRREQDLLNRIQSESFADYVDGSKKLADEPLTSKERKAGIDLAEKIDAAEKDILEVC